MLAYSLFSADIEYIRRESALSLTFLENIDSGVQCLTPYLRPDQLLSAQYLHLATMSDVSFVHEYYKILDEHTNAGMHIVPYWKLNRLDSRELRFLSLSQIVDLLDKIEYAPEADRVGATLCLYYQDSLREAVNVYSTLEAGIAGDSNSVQSRFQEAIEYAAEKQMLQLIQEAVITGSYSHLVHSEYSRQIYLREVEEFACMMAGELEAAQEEIVRLRARLDNAEKAIMFYNDQKT